MYILFATFASGRNFLKSLKHNKRRNQASLAVRTRARYRPGEEVILEVGFSGLPNRVLMRAIALEARGRFPGQRFLIRPEEEDRWQFLAAVAAKPHRTHIQRRHRRFPIKLPVRFFVDDEGSFLRGDAETRDLTPGGMALSTYRLLPDHAHVTLQVDLQGGRTMDFGGHVAWSKRGDKRASVGICFDRVNSIDMKRLRLLLRSAKLFGKTFEGGLWPDPVGVELAGPQVRANGSGTHPAPTAAQGSAPLAIETPNRSDMLAAGTRSAGSQVPDALRFRPD